MGWSGVLGYCHAINGWMLECYKRLRRLMLQIWWNWNWGNETRMVNGDRDTIPGSRREQRRSLIISFGWTLRHMAPVLALYCAIRYLYLEMDGCLL